MASLTKALWVKYAWMDGQMDGWINGWMDGWFLPIKII